MGTTEVNVTNNNKNNNKKKASKQASTKHITRDQHKPLFLYPYLLQHSSSNQANTTRGQQKHHEKVSGHFLVRDAVGDLALLREPSLRGPGTGGGGAGGLPQAV